MSDSNPTQAPTAKPRQGFWLTVGEIVGVLALVIAALNFWDSHRQHQEDLKRQQAQSQAAVAFVATGEADSAGRTLTLRPLKSGQAIQSERYRFPAEIRGDPVEVTAESPRIEVDWLAGGLKQALDAAHAKSSGEARVPVVIETTFVEDGETRTDVSLYQVGVSWKKPFLSGWQVRLRGLALAKRGLAADPGKTLEGRWSTAKKALSGDFALPPA